MTENFAILLFAIFSNYHLPKPSAHISQLMQTVCSSLQCQFMNDVLQATVLTNTCLKLSSFCKKKKNCKNHRVLGACPRPPKYPPLQTFGYTLDQTIDFAAIILKRNETCVEKTFDSLKMSYSKEMVYGKTFS